MNRYPLWKYLLIGFTLVVAFLYTLPNFFGELPAVQVSPARATEQADTALLGRAEAALKAAGLGYSGLELAGNSIKVRLASTDAQIQAKDVLQAALGDAYTVALNLVPASPKWLESINALPMYLGLDLRGGVHFLLEVDMKAALEKAAIRYQGDFRSELRSEKIRYGRIAREGETVVIHFATRDQRDAAAEKLANTFPDLGYTPADLADGFTLTARLKPEAVKQVETFALQQNLTTLRNRVNELGVAEPVIQQQGANRIVVQLPGVQDTAKAKDILGRTATLEVRLVDEGTEARAAESGRGPVPFGSERYLERSGQPVIVKKQVILTGENLTDAQPGFDGQTQEPTVNLTLDAKGSRIFRDITRENIGKRMAIVLFEKGKGEVVTAPVIRSEIGGGRVQISGRMTTAEANDTALLLRAGSLAAPMEIIEEFTIGPSLGADNIERGVNSVVWGLVAIAIFMCAYYMLFGVFSSIALGMNVLLLLAVLSMLQATLTLPGIAAMALAIGVAIDSNVLINERIREELRAGVSPQAAIHTGYERAWATILDSNVTTLIAGLALLAFGSGPVRGFAVVHCIGILTSMFSAVFFSRGLVNLWYGRQKKLKSVSIGTVWKPDGGTDVAKTN